MDFFDFTPAPLLDAEDRLFASGSGHRASIASISRLPSEFPYVEGFKLASDKLVDCAVNESLDQDLLVYPIVFGYRHYLELRLKELLRTASDLLDAEAPDPKIMGEHKLTPLWNLLRPLLERIFADSQGQFDLIGDRLAEFEQIDPDSFAFRYLTSKKGELLLPRDLRAIDLLGLRDVVSKMGSTLDGASDGIDVYRDTKAEAAQEAAELAAGAAEYPDLSP